MFGGGGGIGLPLVLLAVLIGGLVMAARKRAKADSHRRLIPVEVPTRATRSAGGVSTDAVVTAVRRHGPAFAGLLLPFLLVLYLALKEGGYDATIRSEVGIAVWWIVLVGAAVGALPSARITRVAWVGLGLLAAFALWTGLGIGWSESAERSVAELGRVATLLAIFALALSVQGREAARRTAAAVATATGVVAVLALVSRMEPTWIPAEDYLAFLPGAANRLAYPLGYWNGLGELVAIGIPLMVWIAAEGRYTVTRALAVAAIPAMSLTIFLTLSRGAIGAAAIAVLVLIALHPRRVRLDRAARARRRRLRPGDRRRIAAFGLHRRRHDLHRQLAGCRDARRCRWSSAAEWRCSRRP